MSFVRWWMAFAGLVVLALPLGCAREEEAGEGTRNRISDFTEVLAAGNGDSACEMLSDEAAEDLADRVRRDLDDNERRSCPAAVQVAASERTRAEDRALTDLEIGDIDYDEEWRMGVNDDPGSFESATAIVVVADGEVVLFTENYSTDRAGSWTITDPGPILDLLVPG